MCDPLSLFTELMRQIVPLTVADIFSNIWLKHNIEVFSTDLKHSPATHTRMSDLFSLLKEMFVHSCIWTQKLTSTFQRYSIISLYFVSKKKTPKFCIPHRTDHGFWSLITTQASQLPLKISGASPVSEMKTKLIVNFVFYFL